VDAAHVRFPRKTLSFFHFNDCPDGFGHARLLHACMTADAKGSVILAVHRAAIFNVLFDATARAGIDVETGATVTGVQEGTDQRPSFETAAGRLVGPFDFVIDALGSRSSIRQQVWPRHKMRELPFGALWASLETNGGSSVSAFSSSTLEQVYSRSSKMVGVLPIGQISSSSSTYTAFFWSLKQEEFAGWQEGGLNAWKEQALALWPKTEGLLSLIEDAHDLTFARYGHHTLMTPHKGRDAGAAWH